MSPPNATPAKRSPADDPPADGPPAHLIGPDAPPSDVAWYARPAVLDQLSQLSQRQHHVIEASAGTGKTYTIEHLVVDRILAGVDLSRILVVTFTERAAGELRARIRELLWTLRVSATGPTRGPAPLGAWRLDGTARARLALAQSKLDGASVSTIHAFCQRLLTENAFAHRRLFAQELTDGADLFSTILRDELRGPLATNPDTRELLRATLRPGGYDEDGAVESLERLLARAVRFRGRLEPTLDEAAVALALARLPQPLPSADAIAETRRNKSMTPKLQRTFGPLLAALQRARSVEGVQRLVELGALWAGTSEDGSTGDCAVEYALETLEHKSFAASSFADPLRSSLAELAERVPPREALLVQLVTPRLRALLREAKEARGLYDFDDMLELVERSLTGPHASTVIATLRERFRVVLIDEFQDTDPVQWSVFRRLFVDGASPTRLFVIGDPKQAIYGFRSADVETYLAAREALLGTSDLAELDRRIVRLTQNFRSSDRMIRAYNQVLLQSPPSGEPLFSVDPRIQYGPRAAVSCGDPAVKLVDARGAELAPIVVVRAPPIAGKGGKASAGGKGKAVLVGPVARWVAEEIELLLSPRGPRLIDRRQPAEGRRLEANDIFVLTRAKAEATMVADALALRGVPHAFYKLEGLFATPEVGDLVDVLAAVAEPFDVQRRVRAWLTPFFELSPLQAEQALDLNDDHPLLTPLLRWSEFAARRDYPQLFTALVDESGLARRAAFRRSDERALANVLRVLELLGAEARRRHATLPELIDLLRAWRRGTVQPSQPDAHLQPLETDRPAVQLMTMHAAKGLEAGVVFLVGGTGRAPSEGFRLYRREGQRCAWLGRLPARLKPLVSREIDGEAERLLYVALTRAKVRLYLPHYVTTEGGALPLDGTLDALNRRLTHLLAEEPSPELFTVRDLASRGASASSEGGGAVDLSFEAGSAAQRKSDALGSLPIMHPSDAAALEAKWQHLARTRRGGLMTSYSQLAHAAQHPASEVLKDEAAEAWGAAPTARDDLPSSNVVGNFLHDVLEALDLRQVLACADAHGFAQDGAVRALVERHADAAGIAPPHRPHAYRLLYAALRTPVALGGEPTLSCIAAAPRVAREAEFLFPIPERTHPLLGAAATHALPPFAIGRGTVKGFIDLVFEYEGRVYFGDWKSSLLTVDQAADLRGYVDTHFHWQLVVYTVAMVRLLGIRDEAAYARRFGGCLYVFLREMERTREGCAARGVDFQRPDWAQVRAWERELLDHSYGSSPSHKVGH